jgi:hypothetical protein
MTHIVIQAPIEFATYTAVGELLPLGDIPEHRPRRQRRIISTR